MVRLVVEDHDPRGAAEVAADPGNHLAPGLAERARRAGRARQQLLGERADRLALLGLPALELVVVRDDDLRLAEIVVQVSGDEAAELVVVSFLHPELLQAVPRFDMPGSGSFPWLGKFFACLPDTGVLGGTGVAA